jgi:AraC family transcriptional regulator of adaptative response/methylated-DNA-[protein]-cysteine methyltransferase
MSKLTEIEKLAAATTRDPRWQSIVTREKDADGKFFYSVGTTGVYCRPSCAARLPRPENVRFHASTADAEKAGFRACKRCKPTGDVPPRSAVAYTRGNLPSPGFSTARVSNGPFGTKPAG